MKHDKLIHQVFNNSDLLINNKKNNTISLSLVSFSFLNKDTLKFYPNIISKLIQKSGYKFYLYSNEKKSKPSSGISI